MRRPPGGHSPAYIYRQLSLSSWTVVAAQGMTQTALGLSDAVLLLRAGSCSCMTLVPDRLGGIVPQRDLPLKAGSGELWRFLCLTTNFPRPLPVPPVYLAKTTWTHGGAAHCRPIALHAPIPGLCHEFASRTSRGWQQRAANKEKQATYLAPTCIAVLEPPQSSRAGAGTPESMIQGPIQPMPDIESTLC